MTFKTLVIELDRSEETRDLRAYVYQKAADKMLRGKNILSGRHLRLIASAKKAVIENFHDSVEEIEWAVSAAPDFVRKKKDEGFVDGSPEQPKH